MFIELTMTYNGTKVWINSRRIVALSRTMGQRKKDDDFETVPSTCIDTGSVDEGHYMVDEEPAEIVAMMTPARLKDREEADA